MGYIERSSEDACRELTAEQRAPTHRHWKNAIAEHPGADLNASIEGNQIRIEQDIRGS